jgi:hypothetical protein
MLCEGNESEEKIVPDNNLAVKRGKVSVQPLMMMTPSSHIVIAHSLLITISLKVNLYMERKVLFPIV